MTHTSRFYRAVSKVLARTAFQADFIQSVCVRRSAASGEATFPYSDIDFDITITPATGVNLDRLRRRYLLAKILFPQTGQCFVLEPSDPEELSQTDPYRASINNRCFYNARGIPPPWPCPPIGQMEAARRVVFWLQSFFPQAVRQANRRNQRKFYLEMGNALGLLEQIWAEPRVSLREVESAYPIPSGQLFPAALDLAGRAAKCVGRKPPDVTEVLDLPGLTILPGPSSAWPAGAFRKGTIALHAQALDLMLQTQSPELWLTHAAILQQLGFEPPSRLAWIGSARRLAGMLWLRGPGFFEPRDGRQEMRLELARHILEALELGVCPSGPVRYHSVEPGTAGDYYLNRYGALAEEAASLREKLRCLESLESGP